MNEEIQIQEWHTFDNMAKLFLFGLPILILIIYLYYLTNAIPCTYPLGIKGCYVLNNSIQWCCD